MVGNAGSNLTYDNQYNRRIAEIVANYEKVDDFNHPQDFMKHLVGGGKPKPFIQSGDTSYDNESVFDSVGLTAGRAFKQKKKGVAKLLRTVGLAVKPLGKTVKPIKDALVNRVVNEIDGYDGREPVNAVPVEAYDLGLPEYDYQGKPIGGRAYNQKKKGVAKLLRTVGLAVKPLGKTLKPIKEALVARAVSEIGGAKKSSPWIVHVKQYCAKHGCSYKEGLKLASPSYKK